MRVNIEGRNKHVDNHAVAFYPTDKDFLSLVVMEVFIDLMITARVGCSVQIHSLSFIKSLSIMTIRSITSLVERKITIRNTDHHAPGMQGI